MILIPFQPPGWSLVLDLEHMCSRLSKIKGFVDVAEMNLKICSSVQWDRKEKSNISATLGFFLGNSRVSGI
jgi:hypothetical protein